MPDGLFNEDETQNNDVDFENEDNNEINSNSDDI